MPRGIYDRKKLKRAKSAKRSSKRKAPKRIERTAVTARAIKRARKRFGDDAVHVSGEPLVIRALPVLRTKDGVALDANSVDDRLSEVERVLRSIADHASQMDVLIHSAATRSFEIIHKLRDELYDALSREKETV